MIEKMKLGALVNLSYASNLPQDHNNRNVMTKNLNGDTALLRQIQHENQ